MTIGTLTMLVSATSHSPKTLTEKTVSTLSHRIENPSFVARIKASLRSITRDRRGATTVEYLVLVAVIALGGIVAMEKIKGGISSTAEGVTTGITGMTAYKAGTAAPGGH